MIDETLLLALRAETLVQNLIRLKDHLATPDRVQDLQALATTTKAAAKSVLITERAWTTLREKMDLDQPLRWGEKIDPDDSGANPKTVDMTFEDIRTTLSEVRTGLLSIQRTIELMTTKCFQVTQIPVGKEIIEDLRKRTEPVITELRNIQTFQSSNAIASGWKTLREKATSDTDPILTDYMELLGGAALRDTGFDEKISYFADELLTSTGGKFLALPMRREALITTVKQIIRVTFPDWTVWALPSAALEFWNIVGHRRVEETLKVNLNGLPPGQLALIKPEHKKCLGDAYSTYTMGPAYAYYAVGLILDPESEVDHCRVRAILAMLEQMEESKVGTRYLEVRRQLLTAWNAARTQWGKLPLNLDMETSQDADATDSEGAGLRILIGRFWKTLEFETSAKFGNAIWAEVQGWVRPLLERNIDQITVPIGTELRHLLNAAWLARCHPDRNF